MDKVTSIDYDKFTDIGPTRYSREKGKAVLIEIEGDFVWVPLSLIKEFNCRWWIETWWMIENELS